HPPVELLRQRRRVHVHPQEAAPVPQRPRLLPRRPPPPPRRERALSRVVPARHGGVYEGVGPASHHRNPSSASDPSNGARRNIPKRSRVELARSRVELPQQMVRHAAALPERHLVGGDVETPVHLNLIGVHHLAVEHGGQLDGQLRLPRPGGAHDDHHALLPRITIALDAIMLRKHSPGTHVQMVMAALLRHRCDCGQRETASRRSRPKEARKKSCVGTVVD
ncbi:hypothetical protein GW17_00046658, partial [Ensete ventricosum]